MTAQHLVVFALVLACSVYALWTLMPSAARRFVARRLMRLPLGSSLKTELQKAASARSGCDCSGCDKVVDLQRKPPSQVIRLHVKTKD
jgi:ferrous iron transport protein B